MATASSQVPDQDISVDVKPWKGFDKSTMLSNYQGKGLTNEQFPCRWCVAHK